MPPKFSIVLIARNEAKVLPRLLASLEEFKALNGEVCLVDTGSTDGTAQIARNWGCNVEEVGDKYRHVITKKEADDINARFVVGSEDPVVKEGDSYFDFASARNYVASLATNAMVSFADADEVFTKLDINLINEHIDAGADQFEYEFVFAHDEHGNPAIAFVQSKFYNRDKIKWVGIIHEVLSGDGKRVFLDKDVFRLEHWQNVETNRGGYLKGLAVDCFNNPDNDRNSHYFAREMMWCGRPASALKEFERHVEMNRWPSERSQSLVFMGDCYGKLGMQDEQVAAYSRAFHIEPRRREPLLRLAGFYRYTKNMLGVLAYATAALEIPWDGFYANNKADYEHIPHEYLYWAKGWLGDQAGARHHMLKALEYQPYNPRYLDETKYYFEYAAPKIDGYMRFPELQWLYETAKERSPIVELGSFMGRSTSALASGCKGTITAIDTWQGSKDPKDGTHGRDVYGDFIKNMVPYPNVTPLRLSGVEAAKRFADGSIDMMFIDAGHTYEEVKEDIATWLPKIKEGGLICGHDYSELWPGVMQAVDEAFGKDEIGVTDTIWCKTV